MISIYGNSFKRNFKSRSDDHLSLRTMETCKFVSRQRTRRVWNC